MGRTTIRIDAWLKVVIEDGVVFVITNGCRYLPRHLAGALPDVAARVITALATLPPTAGPGPLFEDTTLFEELTPLEMEILERRGIPRR